MVPKRAAKREFAQKPQRITREESARAREVAGIRESAKAIVEAAMAKGAIRFVKGKGKA
jgi:hypothetical protein